MRLQAKPLTHQSLLVVWNQCKYHYTFVKIFLTIKTNKNYVKNNISFNDGT